MPIIEEIRKGSVSNLLKALLVWTFTTGILLPVFSFILWKSGRFSALFGYTASALSFFAAVTAGRAIRMQRGTAWEMTAAAGMIIVLLLTMGYLIREEELNASAILSLSSFTAAGCFAGYFMSREIKKETNSKQFQYRKHRR